MAIKWLADGVSPSYAIAFNAQHQQVLNFTQICAIHVDNTRCSSSINIVFPDTGFQVELGANAEGFYPVLTNGLQFVAFIDLQPVAGDVTTVQVLNFLPPPIEFGQAGAGGPGVGTVRQIDTVAPLQGGPITDTGSVSLSTPLTVNYGGTGAATGALALDNLSGAAGAQQGSLQRSPTGVWSVAVGAGAGTITNVIAGAGLTGGGTSGAVTVAVAAPLAVSLGGTGSTTPAGALSNLGAQPINTAVLKVGDTMSGPLVISQNAAALPAIAGSQVRVSAADGVSTGIAEDSFAQQSTIALRRAQGTAAAPTALTAGIGIGAVLFSGNYGGAATNYNYGAQIYAATSEAWSVTARGSYIAFDTIAPGTITGGQRALIGQGLMVGAPITNDPGPGGIYATGGITIASDWPSFSLRKNAGTGAQILGYQGASLRWNVQPGDGSAETGSNTGSNFQIQRYSDAGANIDAPLSINRASGAVTMTNTIISVPTASNAAVTFTNSMHSWLTADDAAGSYVVYDNTRSVYGIIVNGNTGACQNTTGTWAAFSDERLKKDLADYTAGLAEIRQLSPKTFTYNGLMVPDDGVQHFGLIAQQVEPVMPELIGEFDYQPPEDAPEGRAAGTYKTVDPGRLIYALLNAVKELAAEVDALKGQA